MKEFTYIVRYALKGNEDAIAEDAYISGNSVDDAVDEFRKIYPEDTYSIIGVSRDIKRSFVNR